MACTSTIRRELQSEPSGSWLDWMGVPSSDASDAAASGSQVEAPPAFQPEEVGALYREVFDALQVPRRLSGPRRVRRGPFEIASEIFPAQFFSGDFVSVFDAGETTFLALGDIAGKGLTSAMWSTHMLGLVRTYAAALGSPHAVLGAMNRDLYMLGSVPLTTMVFARLDWRRGELEYSNAGHFAPLLRRANGEVEQLSTGGPVLAAIHDVHFNSARTRFSAGDMLVAYTDGLIECRSQEGEEFGVERLRASIQRSAKMRANEALFSIVGAAQDFAAGSIRNDDLTLMVAAGT
jgi:serine phosphatase RsbU (regulator of sigma subunit)